jgi:hypothetical protein
MLALSIIVVIQTASPRNGNYTTAIAPSANTTNSAAATADASAAVL